IPLAFHPAWLLQVRHRYSLVRNTNLRKLCLRCIRGGVCPASNRPLSYKNYVFGGGYGQIERTYSDMLPIYQTNAVCLPPGKSRSCYVAKGYGKQVRSVYSLEQILNCFLQSRVGLF